VTQAENFANANNDAEVARTTFRERSVTSVCHAYRNRSNATPTLQRPSISLTSNLAVVNANKSITNSTALQHFQQNNETLFKMLTNVPSFDTVRPLMVNN
jgi:hypothetical protein